MMLNFFSPSSTQKQTCCSQLFQTTLIPTISRRRDRRHLGNPSSPPTVSCRLGVGFEDVAAITQNKVLLAATLSAAVGQLSKPLTSSLFYGNDFDLKSALQSGGFPSTHSSAVVATATCLALERGFSDSIFGLAVVYAALIMYDAQGVRREVGKHARTINSIILENRVVTSKSEDERTATTTTSSLQTFPGRTSNGSTTDISPSGSDNLQRGTSVINAVESTSQVEEETDYILGNKIWSNPLFERVGHTEAEVVAGAVLGAVVSLTLYALT